MNLSFNLPSASLRTLAFAQGVRKADARFLHWYGMITLRCGVEVNKGGIYDAPLSATKSSRPTERLGSAPAYQYTIHNQADAA